MNMRLRNSNVYCSSINKFMIVEICLREKILGGVEMKDVKCFWIKGDSDV